MSSRDTTWFSKVLVCTKLSEKKKNQHKVQGQQIKGWGCSSGGQGLLYQQNNPGNSSQRKHKSTLTRVWTCQGREVGWEEGWWHFGTFQSNRASFECQRLVQCNVEKHQNQLQRFQLPEQIKPAVALQRSPPEPSPLSRADESEYHSDQQGGIATRMCALVDGRKLTINPHV